MDKIIRGTAKNGMVRVFGAITTDLVNEATKIHKTSPLASAAFGRLLTGGVLMASMGTKNEKETLSLQINGGGPIKGLTVTAYSNGTVKGYVGEPNVDLPLNSKNKLDVGGAVGTNGTLTVIKDLGLKEPYVGQVPIYTGEIGDDLAYYFTTSEQTPSAVALGVLVDKDLSIKAAGGFIIQMMPDADELLADLITYRLEEIPSVTSMITDGKSVEEMLEFVFEGMDLKLTESIIPKYECNCSRERVERALASIGKKDLQELYDEGKEEELQCHFCNAKYKFTKDDIGKLLEQYK